MNRGQKKDREADRGPGPLRPPSAVGRLGHTPRGRRPAKVSSWVKHRERAAGRDQGAQAPNPGRLHLELNRAPEAAAPGRPRAHLQEACVHSTKQAGPRETLPQLTLLHYSNGGTFGGLTVTQELFITCHSNE